MIIITVTIIMIMVMSIMAIECERRRNVVHALGRKMLVY